MKIVVLYSLPSIRMQSTEFGSTDEDTLVIAKMVSLGLRSLGHKVELVGVAEDRLEIIAQIKADCVFNLIEWSGLDMTIAQRAFLFLRQLNIPVTGSRQELYTLTGDKIRMKERLKEIKANTPKSMVLRTGDEVIPAELPYPMIVKPSLEHCSMGIGREVIAKDRAQLKQIAKLQITKFAQPVLAEEFVYGRELLVYMVESESDLIVLPIEEMIFAETDGSGFQTYETKWEEQSEDYNSTEVVVAKLTTVEEERVKNLAKNVFRGLGLWGYARLDMRLRDGMPLILEANANPSVYDNDVEIEDMNEEVIMGIKFNRYLELIVQAAIRHFENGERV